MAYKKKSESKLIAELNEAHKAIMKARATSENGFVKSHVFAHCFEQVSQPGRPYEPGTSRWAQYVAQLKQSGYLRLVKARDGGNGWNVNPKYLRDENEVKTTILDMKAFVKSKLSNKQECAYDLLKEVAEVVPQFTVKELLEALAKPEWASELGLVSQKTNVVDERLSLQAELAKIKIANVTLEDGRETSLGGIDLWQLYRIATVLGVKEVPKAPEITTVSLSNDSGVMVTEHSDHDTRSDSDKPF